MTTTLAISPGGRSLALGPSLGSLAIAPVSSGGGSGGSSPVWTGLRMSDVSPGNLAGWWDAGLLTGYRDTTGAQPTVWNGSIGTLADLSGNSRPATVSPTSLGNRNPSGPVSIPRCCATLGGLAGFKLTSAGTYWPAMDETVGITVGSVDMRPSVAWSLTLTFSRPNLRQDSVYDGSSPVSTGSWPVLQVAGTTVLQLGNTASDTLTLFPGGAAAALSTTLPRRFTHSVTLVNTPGTGIAAYFDDTLIGSGIANPISSAGTLTLPCGNGQLVFHEAALWGVTLGTTALGNLHGSGSTAAAKRWARGRRKSPILLPLGQSNWSNAIVYTGLAPLQESIRYHLGALGCWVLNSGGSFSSGTGAIVSTGGADMVTGDPTQDAVAQGYPLGTRGQTLVASITALPADMQAEYAGVVELWTEGASQGTYSSIKTNLIQQEREMMAKVRAALGASTPWFTCYAIPYASNDAGMQGMMEMNNTRGTTSGDNCIICAPQLHDTLPSGASYDPSTGAYGTNATGGVAGDNAHRDLGDWPRLVRRMGPVIARTLTAQAVASDLASWPTGLPVKGGPVATVAHYEGTTQGRTNGGVATDTILVTVAHDPGYASNGADFYLTSGALGYCDNGTARPSAAALGAGWMLRDGGTADAPTARVLAVKCERVDATHLRVTLASRVSSATQATPSNGALHYTYGCDTVTNSLPVPSQLGRGNGIYDNLAALTPPAGWGWAGDTGIVENMPLASTPVGLVLS